jgi:hypothetical protein
MSVETIEELRRCPRCENDLPLTNFRPIRNLDSNGVQQYTTYCKHCSREYQRDYRKNGGRKKYNTVKTQEKPPVIPDLDSVHLPLTTTDRAEIRKDMSVMMRNNVELIAQREELQLKSQHLESERELLRQELESLRVQFDKLKLSIPTDNRVDTMPKPVAMREILYHILQGGYDVEVDPIEYINDARAIVEELYK